MFDLACNSWSLGVVAHLIIIFKMVLSLFLCLSLLFSTSVCLSGLQACRATCMPLWNSVIVGSLFQPFLHWAHTDHFYKGSNFIMLNYAVGYVFSVIILQRHTPAFQYVLLPVVWEALPAVDAKPLKRASENKWEPVSQSWTIGSALASCYFEDVWKEVLSVVRFLAFTV